MADISGFSSNVTVVASNTFPAGITITQFTDDVDTIDSAPIDIADKSMGLNGDPIFWAKANFIALSLAVIPGTPDDINLQILADANRVGPGKVSAADQITATIVYPDGTFVTLGRGRITGAPFVKSVASSQRLKSRVYQFAFALKIGT